MFIYNVKCTEDLWQLFTRHFYCILGIQHLRCVASYFVQKVPSDSDCLMFYVIFSTGKKQFIYYSCLGSLGLMQSSSKPYRSGNSLTSSCKKLLMHAKFVCAQAPRCAAAGSSISVAQGSLTWNSPWFSNQCPKHFHSISVKTSCHLLN